MDKRIDLREAIYSQPDRLAKAARAASAALAAAPPALWRPGETVAVVGMGASTHAGTVFVEALRRAGVRAVNIDASAVADLPEGFTPAEHCVIVSESGRSPEPVAAARRFGARLGTRRMLVITNQPGSPVTQAGGTTVPLGGLVDSRVYTVGYTCTLAAMACVAQACGAGLGDPGDLARSAQRALDELAAPAAAFARELAGKKALDLVGEGVSYGSAAAGALLFREAAAIPAAAFETRHNLHGPMEAGSGDTAVVTFGGELTDGIVRQLQADAVLARAVHLPFADGLALAVAETVWAQLAVLELARLSGKRVGDWRFPRPDTKLA
jgi:fructoselysine-6-P-deglycase FrlB-like protein